MDARRVRTLRFHRAEKGPSIEGPFP